MYVSIQELDEWFKNRLTHMKQRLLFVLYSNSIDQVPAYSIDPVTAYWLVRQK
jgi:hypothetical protein